MHRQDAAQGRPDRNHMCSQGLSPKCPGHLCVCCPRGPRCWGLCASGACRFPRQARASRRHSAHCSLALPRGAGHTPRQGTSLEEPGLTLCLTKAELEARSWARDIPDVDMEKSECSHITGGDVEGCSCRAFSRFNIELPYDPTIPLLDLYPEE